MRHQNRLDHFHNSCGLDLHQKVMRGEFRRRRNKRFIKLLNTGRGGE